METEDQEKKQRLGLASVIFMPVVAAFLDLISLIPGLNFISSATYAIIFSIWFWLEGVGFFSGRKLGTMATSMIIEVIPGLSALPSLTIATIAVIIMVKSEDKLGIKLPLAK